MEMKEENQRSGEKGVEEIERGIEFDSVDVDVQR